MNPALRNIISPPTLALIERVADASGRSVNQYLNEFLTEKHRDDPRRWAEALLLPQYSSRAKAERAAEVFSREYAKFRADFLLRTQIRNISTRRWKLDAFYLERRRWHPVVCYSMSGGRPLICYPSPSAN